MKRKILYKIVLLIIGTSLYAEDLSFNFSLLKSTPALQKDKVYNLLSYVVLDNYLIYETGYDGTRLSFEPSYMPSIKKISFIQEGAYIYSLIYNPRTKTYDKIGSLRGQGIFIDLYKQISDTTGRITSAQLSKRQKDFNILKQGLPELDKAVFIESGISSISASSELVEGATSYSVSNLSGRLYVLRTDDYSSLSYDFITPPWVEGVSGYGIGEYIDVSFDEKTRGIQVLNGFVDFDRNYLFYENSRVKTVEVTSINPSFKKEYELKDYVEFTYLEFPQAVDSVRITIKDVYKGTKYDDTCLSAIIPVSKSDMTIIEKKAHVNKMLEENGTLDALLHCKNNDLEFYNGQ